MPTKVRSDDLVLLACSSGGHFTELALVADARGIPEHNRHWAVPRTMQTAGKLEGRANVTWMPEVKSRGMKMALGNLPAAISLHRRLRPGRVISTGAAQAVPHLVAAQMHGTPIAYHESVARLDGPSLTGRVAAGLHAVELFAPQPGWQGGWQHAPDVFTNFETMPVATGPIVRAVVALGGERFGFPRAVEQSEAALPDGVAITWQVGNTEMADDTERSRWVCPDELERAMAEASVVITHGGAGSILTALGVGKVPVVLPRVPNGSHPEHCDDHQVRMCRLLHDRGLAIMVDPAEPLTMRHLERAAAIAVTRTTGAPGSVAA